MVDHDMDRQAAVSKARCWLTERRPDLNFEKRSGIQSPGAYGRSRTRSPPACRRSAGGWTSGTGTSACPPTSTSPQGRRRPTPAAGPSPPSRPLPSESSAGYIHHSTVTTSPASISRLLMADSCTEFKLVQLPRRSCTPCSVPPCPIRRPQELSPPPRRGGREAAGARPSLACALCVLRWDSPVLTSNHLGLVMVLCSSPLFIHRLADVIRVII